MSRLHSIFWPALTGILFAICIWLLQQSSSKPEPLLTPKWSFAEAVDSAKLSVASINTSQVVYRSGARRFNQTAEEIQSSLGSAVIVDDSGYLLTNHHVIAGADRIMVTLYDGRQALAKIVGTDAESDLAVLWIDLPNLNAIQFGNVNTIKVGDIVLAIGNPFGFGHTVTQGIISATGRWGLNPGKYENYLQTDAGINVGNSGGALIDTNGELVGINSAIYSQNGQAQGIGLAIPADLAKTIMEELIQHGAVIRGWLGIGVQELTKEFLAMRQLNIAGGVMVTAVAPNGPAGLAGIKPGDIITEINEQALEDGRSGMIQVAMLAPGTSISIEILRNNTAINVPVIVGRKPAVN